MEQNFSQHQVYTGYHVNYADRDTGYCPATDSTHDRLMQVELVNQRINKIKNNKSDGLINLQSRNNMITVYDNKEQDKLQLQLRNMPKKMSHQTSFLLPHRNTQDQKYVRVNVMIYYSFIA